MNAPHARNKEACQALCKGIATINEIDPALCASILILPDYARGSSIRGLFDEEKQLFEELYSLCQNCECRWVEVYARESRRADQRSNARRFGLGRVITSSQKIEDNKWLNSELSVYGRAVGSNESTEGAPTAILPRTSTILIPEPASPEASFRLMSVLFDIFLGVSGRVLFSFQNKAAVAWYVC